MNYEYEYEYDYINYYQSCFKKASKISTNLRFFSLSLRTFSV